MRNLLNRIGIFILSLKSLFVSKHPSQEDIEWHIEEVQRKKKLKKEHFFLYLFEKVEKPLMITGFISFFIDPFLRVYLPFWLYMLFKMTQGGAMGLGFGVWLLQPFLRRMNFETTNHFMNFLKKIDKLMGKTSVGIKQVDRLPN